MLLSSQCSHHTTAAMFGHTAKASGYSLRINTHLHQLPKTNTGSLTKKTLLLKCLAICCVIGSVGASAAERVSLVANAGSSPTYSMEFTDLQAKVSVHMTRIRDRRSLLTSTRLPRRWPPRATLTTTTIRTYSSATGRT